jgi:hypothetical protein
MKVFATQLLLAIFASACIAAEPQVFTSEQLREDLAVVEAGIARVHPDVSHSVDPQKLAHGIAQLRAKLDQPMTAHAAWVAMSTLNPLFADGHLVLTYPGGTAGELKRHLQSGGKLFPFNVYVDARGDLFIRSKLNGDATPLQGKKISKLDGVPARKVAAELLAHMNGDTPVFRAALVSKRFAFFYWKLFGEKSVYRVDVGGKPMAVDGATDMPLAYADKSFEQTFQFELLADRAAVLTVGEFYWSDKPKFYAFTEQAFTRMRDAGTKTLIIDVSDTPGGDDDMWLEGILPYVATKPFHNGSTYALKIIEGRQKEGQKVGDVVRASQETVYQPTLDNPLRFQGKVYVLIGAPTYSSAVLFATAMQDAGFATIAGVGGAVRSTQSGGIQSLKLPNTGIGLVVPRFVLTRTSGAEGLLTPDLEVLGDPLKPRAAVEDLVRRSRE